MKKTASHQINQLTSYVMVSPAEASVWTKVMRRTADLKIKMTRRQLTLNLLRRLLSKRVGTNSVEFFAYNDTKVYRGAEAVRRRKKIVKHLMKAKVQSAEEELTIAKKRYESSNQYLQRRWGVQRNVMIPFGNILQREVRSVWEQGNKNIDKKVKHLVEKWKVRNTTSSESQENGIWRNIKFGDEALSTLQTDTNAGNEVAIKYGHVETSQDEEEFLKLPPKFTTYDPISIEKIDIEAEVLLTKIRWETMGRRERGGEPWSIQWEDNKLKEKSIFDRGSNCVQYQNLRVTDMNTCRRILLPQPASNEQEIIMGNIKQRIREVTKRHIDKYCNIKGFPRYKNLTISEEKGGKSLKKRCEAGEIIVQQTDKSKRMAVVDTETYKKSMEPHIGDDPVLTWEEQKQIENKLNGHTLQVGRIFMLGKKWGPKHVSRVEAALRSRNALRPPLYGLAKDHKPLVQEGDFMIPPQRPVCGAQESVNGPLSQILSELIDCLADELDSTIDTECHSTEDLIASINQINNIDYPSKNPVMFSMDVKALYPSLDAVHVAALVRDTTVNSNITFEVDKEELSLYLAITRSRDELTRLGLDEVTHTRKSRIGRAPGITTEEVLNRRKGAYNSKFNKPSREPENNETRLMISLALESAVLAVMNGHMYKFSSVVRRQQNGGPIGLRVSGSLARLVMIHWSKKVQSVINTACNEIRELSNFRLHCIKIYVDDTNIICDVLPPGIKFCKLKHKLVVDKSMIEQQIRMPVDTRTAEIFQDIGNNIFQYIKLTVDSPSNHDDGWMPVLDIKVNVQDKEILFCHYRKPMCNSRLILARSALPTKTKMTTAVCEGLRILQNTSPSLGWDFAANQLSELALRLKHSGYREKFREEVIRCAVIGHERKVERERMGGRPLNRPKNWERQERVTERRKENRMV